MLNGAGGKARDELMRLPSTSMRPSISICGKAGDLLRQHLLNVGRGAATAESVRVFDLVGARRSVTALSTSETDCSERLACAANAELRRSMTCFTWLSADSRNFATITTLASDNRRNRQQACADKDDLPSRHRSHKRRHKRHIRGLRRSWPKAGEFSRPASEKCLGFNSKDADASGNSRVSLNGY